MKSMNRIACVGVLVMSVMFVSACGGGSSGGDTGTGATLTGTVNTFTASLATEKKSLFARIKDFFLPKATAAASGVAVSLDGLSTSTDSSGHFAILDIPEGTSTVTFTQNGSSATYSLMGVGAGETFTLDDIIIAGGTVSTAHTGTWTGTMWMDIFTGNPQEVELTIIIDAGGNSLTGTMVVDEGGLGEVGTFSGVENGTTLDARWHIPEDGEGCDMAGPLTGTFDGDTLEGNEPIDTSTGPGCQVWPGDDNPESHPFTLTKQH